MKTPLGIGSGVACDGLPVSNGDPIPSVQGGADRRIARSLVAMTPPCPSSPSHHLTVAVATGRLAVAREEVERYTSLSSGEVDEPFPGFVRMYVCMYVGKRYI